jgi:hypothetical protein
VRLVLTRRGAGILAIALLGALMPVGARPAAAAPPSGGVGISVVTVKGSGCKKGSAVATVSPDREAFTVTYSGYMAQVGAEVKNRESRKNCKIDAKLSIPKGYAVAVIKSDFRGFALLEDGVTALQRARYKYQGMPDKVFVEHPFVGPFDDFWQTTDVTEPGSVTFGPCGKARTISIDTELRITAGKSDPETANVIVMDSTDGEVNTVYHLTWRTCT